MRVNRRPASAALSKVAWRYLISHPLQSGLMLLGITLGVAVAVSVDVANASAERAFELSTEAISGRTTHYISGGPTGIPEAFYGELRLNEDLNIPIAPVLIHLVNSPQIANQSLQLLGVDPFAEGPFRSYYGNGSESLSPTILTEFLARPGAVLLSNQLATENGIAIGDPIELILNGQVRSAFVAGLIEAEDALSARALENLLLADIATVQELSNQLGILERIDLIIPAENSAEILGKLENQLPVGVSIFQAEGRNQAVEQMTSAFRTNLTALSLLGLLVGFFLIYNTMTFSVVQRRKSFGTLRALGVTGREIFSMVLWEAFFVAILGSALGILLGIVLGRGAVNLVSQTINDLFFALSVRGVSLPIESLIKGGLLGIAATLFATILPAWEAAQSPPSSTLSRARVETLSQRLVRWAALLGVLIASGSALALISLELELNASFAFTFGVVIGFALLAPWLTRLLMPPIARLLGRLFGPIGRLAPREVSNSASRTSVAMAALMVAVAVTIGVSLMVSSFRQSVVLWLDQILSNDIYVSVAGASLPEPMVAIEDSVLSQVENWQGIDEMHLLRNVQVDSPYGPIMVSANNNPNDGEEQVYVSAIGSGSEVWAEVQKGAVMISEPLANRLSLGLGDSLELFGDNGPRNFVIAAVFSDYTSSQGNVAMWLPNYQALWADNAITAFSAGVESDYNVDEIVDQMRVELSALQQLNIRSNLSLRNETLEVFDRTFAITRALQVITTLVAFVGVLSAMLSLQLEKQRQLGIMKAIGLSVRQLWGFVLIETGLIGALAGLLALPTGYAVALILVRLINRRSFGWTFELFVEAEPFVIAFAVSIIAALLAGIYPAYRIGKLRSIEAMRFD
jgi:putative ABC transport system permease protein